MTAPPIIRGPRDLPGLRDWLAKMWSPGEPFDVTAAMRVQLMDSEGQRAAAGDSTSQWNHQAMRDATLWWVDANMVDLIEQSSTSLPPVTLQDELVPHDEAFVVFERPLVGLDSEVMTDPDRPRDGDHEILVDGVMWSKSSLPRVDGPGRRHAISMMSYRCVKPAEGLTKREMIDVSTHMALIEALTGGEPGSHVLTAEMWLPLGRSDWVVGDDWDDIVHPSQTEVSHRSQAEDRRWLATLWALASQPNVVNLSEQQPTRPQRREAQRKGYSAAPIRVVSLRGHVYEGAGASRETVEGSSGRRTYRVRWPVEGHWRNQAYGPGRAYRRPTYIAPYIKGPEGAPLRKGSTVHVLSEDR